MKVFYSCCRHEIPNGSFLSPQNASHQPVLRLTRRLKKKEWHTIIMFDPDAVGGNKIHWLVANIHNNIENTPSTLFDYLSPHPPQNSGYHRYILWILEHSSPLNISNDIKKIFKKTRFIGLFDLFVMIGMTSPRIIDTFFFLSAFQG